MARHVEQFSTAIFDSDEGWNITFAGCGFLGVYYVGVASCLEERAPHILKGASKICGASAGALLAAVLAVGTPLAECCKDLIEYSKDSHKRNLGPLHPNFKLLKSVRDSLNRQLPADAHVLANGRLCLSLTRVSDGKNVLVSDFSSKEELIQALICSCFIPVYCGLIPPSFRGVRYIDGAVSNNLPRFELKNTISVSPFSGESDICPKDNSPNFHEVRVRNVSIQMNLGNVYRVTKVFFPAGPELMAEMCQNGYRDALRFLKDNNLLAVECPSAGLTAPDGPLHCCSVGGEAEPESESEAMQSTKDRLLRRLNLQPRRHWWLDKHLVAELPVSLKKLFCEACRETHGLYAQVTDLLPVRVASYMLLPYTLPVESAYSVAQRFVEWIPDASDDVRWLCEVAGDVYRQAWKAEGQETQSEDPLQKPLAVLQGPQREEDECLPLSVDLQSCYWDSHLPLTPPPTPPLDATAGGLTPGPGAKDRKADVTPGWPLRLGLLAGLMSPPVPKES